MRVLDPHRKKWIRFVFMLKIDEQCREKEIFNHLFFLTDQIWVLEQTIFCIQFLVDICLLDPAYFCGSSGSGSYILVSALNKQKNYRTFF